MIKERRFATGPGKPRKTSIFKIASRKPDKIQENVENMHKSRNCFWIILDRKYHCSKMGVATKGVAFNACSPLKSLN